MAMSNGWILTCRNKKKRKEKEKEKEAELVWMDHVSRKNRIRCMRRTTSKPLGKLELGTV